MNKIKFSIFLLCFQKIRYFQPPCWGCWLLAIALVTIISYFPILGNEFTLDDQVVNAADYPRSISQAIPLLWESVTYREISFYRPLTFFSFALDYNIYGKYPIGYHATNIMLAVLAAWLAFLFLKRLPIPQEVAGWTCLLWCAIPSHAETVYSIFNRSQILAAFFIFLALWTAIQAFTSSKKMRMWIFLSFCATFLACISKENGMILPWLSLTIFYPLLSLFAPQSKRPLVPIWITIVVVQLLAVLGYLLLRYMALQTIGSPYPDSFAPDSALLTRYTQHCYILEYYFLMLLQVVPPCIDHAIAPVASHWLTYFFPLLLIGSMGAVLQQKTTTAGKLMKVLGLAFFWFWGNLIPVLHLHTLLIAAANRLLYPASLSICFLFVLICFYLYSLRKIWLSFLANFLLISILIFCIHATFQQAQLWRNNYVLWQHSAAIYPQSYRAQIIFGVDQQNQGNTKQALQHWHQAWEFKPNRVNQALLYLNQGVLANTNQDYAKARQEWTKILQIYPEHRQAHLLLGDLAMKQGNYETALKHYQTIAQPYNRWDQGYINILERLAFCQEKKGQWYIASFTYQKILARDPQNFNALRQAGIVYLTLGKSGLAIEYLRQALLYDPDNHRIWYALALAYQQLGDDAKARQCYQNAQQKWPLDMPLPPWKP